MAVGDSGWGSFVDGFLSTWRRVITDPHGFIADMPLAGGLGHPAAFLVVCAAVNAAGHLISGWGIVGLLWVLIAQVIAALLAAVLFVLVAQHLFNGRAGFEPTFRVVAYASAPLVFLWVPLVGWLARIYSAYLLVRGLERVQGLDTTRAVLTMVLGLGALWLLRAVRMGGPAWF